MRVINSAVQMKWGVVSFGEQNNRTEDTDQDRKLFLTLLKPLPLNLLLQLHDPGFRGDA